MEKTTFFVSLKRLVSPFTYTFVLDENRLALSKSVKQPSWKSKPIFINGLATDFSKQGVQKVKDNNNKKDIFIISTGVKHSSIKNNHKKDQRSWAKWINHCSKILFSLVLLILLQTTANVLGLWKIGVVIFAIYVLLKLKIIWITTENSCNKSF